MTAAELLAEVRSLGAVLTPRGDRLHVAAPLGTLTPDLKTQLAEAKPALLALLWRELSASTARPIQYFRLPDHAPTAWAVLLGVPGQSLDDLRQSLFKRWPTATLLHPAEPPP